MSETAIRIYLRYLLRRLKVKRIFGVFLVVFLTLAFWSTPTLAAGGGEVEVTLGDITVVPDDSFYEGTWVTISGSIYVLSSAEAFGLIPYAEVYSEDGYEITNPEGDVVVWDSLSDCDEDWGLLWASAEAGVCLPWEVEIQLEGKPGEWEASQYGLGEYYWKYLKLFWPPKWKYGSGDDYDENSVKFYSIYDNRPKFQVGMPWGWDSCDYGIGGISRDLFMVGYYSGSQYAILIPKGAKVTEPNGTRPLKLWFGSLVNNIPTISPSATFSQPCTLYKVDGYMYRTQAGEWVGGKLVEVGKF